MFPKIKNRAIFIADAHESENRDDFFKFLKKIENKEITTPQLFLMGDMFDLLVGKVEYGVKKRKKYIELIDKIALHVEVIYFEGNHDFNLDVVFKNVQVIPIEKQPIEARLEDETLVFLSHGDSFEGFGYGLYTSLIRSNIVIKIYH